MKHHKNSIPTTFPILSEAGHERLVRPVRLRDARKQESRHPSQPMIKIVQLPPCNHCHCRVPSKGNARAGACYENHGSRPPLPPSHERQVRKRASHNSVSAIRNSVVPSSNSSPIAMEETPSTHTIFPLHQASTPKKHPLHAGKGGIRIQREIRDIPSSSTLSSNNPDASVRHWKRVSPSKTAREPTSSRGGAMSERAAETIRIMEWTKKRVKAAEKNAREHEREQHEQKEFLLRLRIWEAQMKFRNLVEVIEGDEWEDDGHEDEYLEPRFSWIGTQSQMGRLGKLARDGRRRCLRGLATVLDR